MAEERVVALSRLISMVRHIDSKPGVSVAELAQHFARSPRAIRRDINLLDRAGIGDLLPGRTFEIDYDLFVEEDRVSLRSPLNLEAPLPLTANEFAQLVTALQAMAPTLNDDDLRLLPETLSTLLAAAGPRTHSPGSSSFATSAMSADTAKKIAVVRTALEDAHPVAFCYVSASGRRSERALTVHSLTSTTDGWVMSGWCHNAHAERTFRLDRASDLTVSSVDALPVTRGASAPDNFEEVTVVFSASALWALRESAAISIEENTDGTLTAKYRVWDVEWLRTQLLLLAPHVISTSPSTYMEDAGRFAQRALRQARTEGQMPR